MNLGLHPRLTEEQLRDLEQENAEAWLASLTMYGPPSAPLFGAIWLPVQDEVRARTIHVLDIDVRFPKLQLGGQGYTTLIAVTGSLTEEGYRIAFVNETFPGGVNPPIVAFSNKTFSLSSSAVYQGKNLQLRTVRGLDYCIYTRRGAQVPLYAGVFFDPPAARPGSSVGPPRTKFNFLEFDVEDFGGIGVSPEHHAILNGWARLHVAIPAPRNNVYDVDRQPHQRHVLFHYRDETYRPWPYHMSHDMSEYAGGTPVVGPLHPNAFPTALDAQTQLQPYWPIMVGANGTGEHARMCVTIAPSGQARAKSRYFFVADGLAEAPARIQIPARVPARQTTAAPPFTQQTLAAAEAQVHLDAIDEYFKTQLWGGGERAATFAVAKNGRLKLVRAYTFAEVNHPITTVHSKFRWGSCAKMLLGMRAVAEDDDDLTWLNTSVADAYGFTDSELSSIGLPPNDGRLTRLKSVRVMDLLRMASGWSTDKGAPPPIGGYDYLTKTWEDAGRELPLALGMFRDFILNSGLEFIVQAPATHDHYNNGHFYALAELVSRRIHGTRTDLYVDQMKKWWRLRTANHDYAIVIPDTRNKCLEAGEAICRGAPKVSRGTVVNSDHWPEIQSKGELPPLLPGAYSGGRDQEYRAGSGTLTMSAASMAFILQSMHPNPPFPVQSRLSPKQVANLALSNPAVSFYGMGCGSLPMAFGGHSALQIWKSGDIDGGAADIYHFVWGNNTEHLSLVRATNTNQTSVGIGPLISHVDALEQLGYWDGNKNLFPALFPDVM